MGGSFFIMLRKAQAYCKPADFYSKFKFIAIFINKLSGSNFIAKNARGAAKAEIFIKAYCGNVISGDKQAKILRAGGFCKRSGLFDGKYAETFFLI